MLAHPAAQDTPRSLARLSERVRPQPKGSDRSNLGQSPTSVDAATQNLRETTHSVIFPTKSRAKGAGAPIGSKVSAPILSGDLPYTPGLYRPPKIAHTPHE